MKRLGATALPIRGTIAGKSFAVVTVVFLQTILLGIIEMPASRCCAAGAATAPDGSETTPAVEHHA